MTNPALTVAYLTCRKNPRFEGFVASFLRELRATPELSGEGAVQVVVVESRLWYDDTRRATIAAIVDGRFPIEHVPPKPTVWQGPHRLTTKDYFCAANTRNTAFALTRAPHVAFVDDLSVLVPGWLVAHLHAATHRYVLAGTTTKCLNVRVDPDGSYACDPHPPGVDSRLRTAAEGALSLCGGSWLYGGTFSVPIERALAVNGQDEVCDSIGGEDYDFGVRLERTGVPVYFSRVCGTIEDELAHHALDEAVAVRLDKPAPGPDGPYSSNVLYNRLMREAGRTWTLGNHYTLRDLRARVLAGEPFPVGAAPAHHWLDGQPLSEM